MEKIIIQVIILTIIISLTISFLINIYYPKNTGQNIDKDKIFENCQIKSGVLPSTEFQTCNEHCAFASNLNCVSLFLQGDETLGNSFYPAGCGTSIDTNVNNFIEYRCLCC